MAVDGPIPCMICGRNQLAEAHHNGDHEWRPPRIVVSREWEFETTDQRGQFMEKWRRDPTEAVDWYNEYLLPKLMQGDYVFKGREKD